ncbi:MULTISPECIES: hypothetical protein [Listeria]|uniref:Uncharacterized protein n=2 Tax=Listeria monocytogenes TaxID=1639 RepID=A0A9P1WWJ0_LISMN|nr:MULTISPECIES: hypothetical protein [Listeria]EAC2277222.1 hypothetical protein [Listeria monocytogenes]EAC2292018.1 hypothetical protein [Listeria monocytogenes]EAC2304420.1 hypothetical protein [Listeria monocytogenes]EAC3010715.1 hypothetical protein [Listeria monocytogenes]EAC3032395.1 hypothetical protein [Listeria monocytogenes]
MKNKNDFEVCIGKSDSATTNFKIKDNRNNHEVIVRVSIALERTMPKEPKDYICEFVKLAKEVMKEKSYQEFLVVDLTASNCERINGTLILPNFNELAYEPEPGHEILFQKVKDVELKGSY